MFSKFESLLRRVRRDHTDGPFSFLRSFVRVSSGKDGYLYLLEIKTLMDIFFLTYLERMIHFWAR